MFWLWQFVWVTATMPYVVLFILLIRGCMLEGSLKGIIYYVTPVWSEIAKKEVSVNIIYNLALKIFVYPFFYCLAGSFYHRRFGSLLRLRFSSPWVLGSGFCWRYQATTSWTTTVTSKRVSWQISPCHLYIYKVFRLLWTSQFSSCKCVRRIRFWWRNF